MNNDDGFWIVVDDDGSLTDNWELEENQETISGLNILTGCYGLFLIADEKTTNYNEDALIIKAFDAIDDLDSHHDTVADAMHDAFPGTDLSHNGILQLAQKVVELRDHIDTHPGWSPTQEHDVTTNRAKNLIQRLVDEMNDELEEDNQKDDDDE